VGIGTRRGRSRESHPVYPAKARTGVEHLAIEWGIKGREERRRKEKCQRVGKGEEGKEGGKVWRVSDKVLCRAYRRKVLEHYCL
jgi:hypothetical protein